jgi:hypothetical protein
VKQSHTKKATLPEPEPELTANARTLYRKTQVYGKEIVEFRFVQTLHNGAISVYFF